jgi:hypothetical protein
MNFAIGSWPLRTMPLNHAMRGSSTAISRSKNFNPPHARSGGAAMSAHQALRTKATREIQRSAEFKGNKFSAASMLLFWPD